MLGRSIKNANATRRRGAIGEALAEVPINNLLGVVAAERDWCGWALAATDGHGAIGRSTRPHLLFWLIIGLIFGLCPGRARRWL